MMATPRPVVRCFYPELRGKEKAQSGESVVLGVGFTQPHHMLRLFGFHLLLTISSIISNDKRLIIA
jgi:hypothetical protein